ncbi:MAG: hypothetical protein HY744_00895 [Deltaproteobacteria bacterium]|nr:hypothetical protein [Deltaproteobacteria bacterium]
MTRTEERRYPGPPPAALRRRLGRRALVLLAVPLCATALWQIVQLLRIFWGRFDYPMDLEWMEGGQLLHAYRVLHGQPLYGDCADGFLPFPYSPVHPLLLAAAGALFGLDYGVARLLSVAGFVLCCLVLCREVARASRSRAQAAVLVVAALGLLASSYALMDGWYDLVRVDAVFAAFLLAGAALSLPAGQPLPGRRRLGPARIVACAACVAGALYAKQTAIFFVPWICGYALWRERRSGWWLALDVAVACTVPLGLLCWVTQGRFWTFVFTVMSRHELFPQRVLASTVRLLAQAPYLLLLPPVALWLHWRRRLQGRTAFWLGMLLCAFVASCLTAAKIGAHVNNLMTAALLSGPVALLVLPDALDAMRRRGVGRYVVAGALSLLVASLLHGRRLDPGRYVPDAALWRSARALGRLVRSLPGPVLFPAHSFVPVRAGKRNVQIHEQGYVDVMGAAIESIDLVACLERLDARWLLVDSRSEPYFQALLDRSFERRGELPAAAQTPVGVFTRPRWRYERRGHIPGRLARQHRRLLFDFESGGYAGWEQQGEAFAAGPSTGRNGYQWPIVGHVGRFLADSFHPRRGDGATGRLRSAPFAIDRSHLGFRSGGGASPALRVELEVDGRPVLALGGPGRNFEVLLPVAWDVSAWHGHLGRLVLVDDERGGWGHLLLDEVELFDVRSQ